MSQQDVLDVVQNAIWSVFKTAAPPLIMGLTVGILVSLFQTITSIQEPTLAFVPKIIAVLLSLIIFGPYMLTMLNELLIYTFSSIPNVLVPK